MATLVMATLVMAMFMVATFMVAASMVTARVLFGGSVDVGAVTKTRLSLSGAFDIGALAGFVTAGTVSVLVSHGCDIDYDISEIKIYLKKQVCSGCAVPRVDSPIKSWINNIHDWRR
jgi:hypothetical protein